MGRGGYDVTDARKEKSLMADAVLTWENKRREQEQQKAARVAAENAEQKLIKDKKSRGILAAKKAAKDTGVQSEPADGSA